MMQGLIVLVTALAAASASLPPSCDHPVYCDSQLLHHVQMSEIYTDSKTFVDFPLKQDQNSTLQAFDELLKETNNNPSKEDLQVFIDKYFETNSTELEPWSPPDYNPNPAFLASIRDEELKQFAKDVHAIWPTLGRMVKEEVKQNPEHYSFIPVSHGVIIPGGRFTELYYWDTYWIIEGLLISGMEETVKGMIANLIELLVKLGHIPNGSRWYYQERSQPPLLSAMMSIYIRHTGDLAFLKENIDKLESELQYWLDTQRITFSMEDKDRAFTLLRYYAPSKGPRPESYKEDYKNAQQFNTSERQQEFYTDIKSAAESGWDFSTRWFIDQNGDNTGHLTNIHTQHIIPVDLNSIFANALQNMVYFQALVGNRFKATNWARLARQWRADIEDVLWHEKDGVWYDYDLKDKLHRQYFYPSNVAPLWMGAIEKDNVKKHAPRVVEYLRQSHGLDYPGGVPMSLIHSGEQWDFPNAWPPLVSVVVNALEALDSEDGYKLAFEVAQTWVRSCYIGFKKSKQMFEKYDVQEPGKFGEGGEYTVQEGFGWSNGVVLEFLAKYGQQMRANDDGNNETSEKAPAPIRILEVLGIGDYIPKSPEVPNSPASPESPKSPNSPKAP
ncbi:trehalase domain-containing protein [Phthorimaea operculella]|nr:trehalase domain-containing protein [Phthorimaea operculella]